MYNANDTIIAVSSALAGRRKIIRLSGLEAFAALQRIVDSSFAAVRGVHSCNICLGDIKLPALIYVFPGPDSYTGDDLLEIHADIAGVAAEKIIQDITAEYARLAEPGEFTARAFLNGKMDIASAEAVAEIVSATSELKLSAARELLGGRLTEAVARIKQNLLELMSLIELGLDFSDQDIPLNDTSVLLSSADKIISDLQAILVSSVKYNTLLESPTVTVAGLPNAGKSSLVNALLGLERSIVSSQYATTRDILAGQLKLNNNSCILQDSPGLIENLDSDDVINILSQKACLSAVSSSDIVIFCIDPTKDDFADDLAALRLVNRCFNGPLLYVITKSDLISDSFKIPLSDDILDRAMFVSSQTGFNIDVLKDSIDKSLVDKSNHLACKDSWISINHRHASSIDRAVSNISKARCRLSDSDDEIAAMFLRDAYSDLTEIQTVSVDEQMLEMIFASFCIGK